MRGVDNRALNPGGRAARTIHRVSGGGFPAVTAAGPSVIVEDDDEAALVFDQDSVTVDEATQGTAAYTIALASRPTAEVTVFLASADAGAATVSPESLTFAQSDWNVPRPVTVTAVDNEVNQSGTMIVHVARGGGYGDAPLAPMPVKVIENDPAEVEVAFSGDALLEGGDPVRMTVNLGQEFTSGSLRFCNASGYLNYYNQRLVPGEADNAHVTLKQDGYASKENPALVFGPGGVRYVVVEFEAVNDSEPWEFVNRYVTLALCEPAGDDIRVDRDGSGGAVATGLPRRLELVDDDNPTWHTLEPWISFGDGSVSPSNCEDLEAECAGGRRLLAEVDEGDTLTLRVNLNHPLETDLTVPLYTSTDLLQQGVLPDLEAEDGDFSVPAEVTIPAGRDSVSFTVQANSDGDDANDYFTVRLGEKGDSYRRFRYQLDEALVNIRDSEAPQACGDAEPEASIYDAPARLGDGGWVFFQVELSCLPERDLTVSYTVAPAGVAIIGDNANPDSPGAPVVADGGSKEFTHGIGKDRQRSYQVTHRIGRLTNSDVNGTVTITLLDRSGYTPSAEEGKGSHVVTIRSYR